MTSPDETRALAARTHAEHNLAYAEALGGTVRRTDDLVAVDIGSPAYYLNAVVPLRPCAGDEIAEVAGPLYDGRSHVVVDYFAVADLAGHGYAEGYRLPVMVREPAPPPPAPPGLAVELVRDAGTLAEFERAMIEGMDIAPYAGAPAGSLWSPGVLDRPSLRLYVGRVGTRAVSTAAAVAVPGAVGLFAISTASTDRRRGFGAGVTAAALAGVPGVPAVLSSSPLGLGVYTALGFTTIGERRGWRFGDSGT